LRSPLHAKKFFGKKKENRFFTQNHKVKEGTQSELLFQPLYSSTFRAKKGFFRMEKENVLPGESRIISFLIISYLLFQDFLFH
jgi:hypothetical protein